MPRTLCISVPRYLCILSCGATGSSASHCLLLGLLVICFSLRHRLPIVPPYFLYRAPTGSPQNPHRLPLDSPSAPHRLPISYFLDDFLCPCTLYITQSWRCTARYKFPPQAPHTLMKGLSQHDHPLWLQSRVLSPNKSNSLRGLLYLTHVPDATTSPAGSSS